MKLLHPGCTVYCFREMAVEIAGLHNLFVAAESDHPVGILPGCLSSKESIVDAATMQLDAFLCHSSSFGCLTDGRAYVCCSLHVSAR